MHSGQITCLHPLLQVPLAVSIQPSVQWDLFPFQSLSGIVDYFYLYEPTSEYG